MFAWPQGPIRSFEVFGGKPLLWFGPKDEIYVDGYVWAQAYGLEYDPEAVTRHIQGLLGEVRILLREEPEIPF